jgi:subtilisin family serine protease
MVSVAIIDSGVNPNHPHVGGIAGGVGISPDGKVLSPDYLDHIGHGTAVAGAIREKAPDAALYAVKVFDRALTTEAGAIIRALEWAIERECTVINLSLGTINMAHREEFERVVSLAQSREVALVAAFRMSGQPSLPGCLPPVIAVEGDPDCPRDSFRPVFADGNVIKPGASPLYFLASTYPREIPGVPRERNLNGISFAVANMTGFVARAMQEHRQTPVSSLKELLAGTAGSTTNNSLKQAGMEHGLTRI